MDDLKALQVLIEGLKKGKRMNEFPQENKAVDPIVVPVLSATDVASEPAVKETAKQAVEVPAK